MTNELDRGPFSEEEMEGYLSARTSCGWFPLQRDVISFSGSDARSYLQGQLSQDVSLLAEGGSASSLLLSPQGKLVALVRVICLGEQEFVIDTDAGWGQAVQERLAKFKLRSRFEMEPLAWSCIALRGPLCPSPSTAVSGAEARQIPVASDWQACPGYDLIGESPQPPPTAKLVPPAAAEALFVESGTPRMGTELDEKSLPPEAGLVERSVSFTKGCYTGQELVARLDARGNRVPKRLRGVVVSERALPGRDDVLSKEDGAEIGAVTSSAWSPALGAPIALAYIRREVVPPAQALLSKDGRNVACEIRELALVNESSVPDIRAVVQ